jgi:hypothetical protein
LAGCFPKKSQIFKREGFSQHPVIFVGWTSAKKQLKIASFFAMTAVLQPKAVATSASYIANEN